MAESKIYRFADEADQGSVLSDTDYENDEQRPIGHQPGVARAELENKALRQSSSIAASMAQFVASNQPNDVDDSKETDALAGYIQAAIQGLIDDAVTKMQLPTGSVYTNTKDSRNPATILGYGTWTALGPGRVILGVSANHPLGEKGGKETVSLDADQNGQHFHYQYYDGGDNDALTQRTYTVAAEGNGNPDDDQRYKMRGRSGQSANVGRTSASGSGNPHENMMPYIAAYQWERVK